MKPGLGELAAGHRQRAMMEIDAEDVLDRMIEASEGAHETREREIAEAGDGLGAGHLVVDDDILVVGEIADEAHDFADQLLRRMAGEDQVADRDRPGIDERITRLAAFMLELHDRVEGRTGRLAPDPVPDILAMLAERQRQREHLGNALDRERHLRIADAMHLAARRDDRHAEMLRINAGKLRYVIGNLALAQARRQLAIDVVEDQLQILWRFLLRHTALLDLDRERMGGSTRIPVQARWVRSDIHVQKNRPSPGGFRN